MSQKSSSPQGVKSVSRAMTSDTVAIPAWRFALIRLHRALPLVVMPSPLAVFTLTERLNREIGALAHGAPERPSVYPMEWQTRRNENSGSPFIVHSTEYA